MNLLRSTLGLMAIAGLACLAMAAPASAENSVLNVSSIKLGVNAVASQPGHVLALNLDQVTLPPEVGVPSRDAVCTPASSAAKIAMYGFSSSALLGASPEVGAGGTNVGSPLFGTSSLVDSA